MKKLLLLMLALNILNAKSTIFMTNKSTNKININKIQKCPIKKISTIIETKHITLPLFNRKKVIGTDENVMTHTTNIYLCKKNNEIIIMNLSEISIQHIKSNMSLER